MTVHSFTPHVPHRVSWIDRLIETYRTSRARDHALHELESFSEERLRDIGVARYDIAQRVDAGMAKVNLKRLGRIGLC